MNETIKIALSQMDNAELKNVIKYVQTLLFDDNEPMIEVKYCPHCGSLEFIKYGKSNGNQRYQCIKCKKTFSENANKLDYNSKLTKEQWLEFIKCEVAGMTLEQTKEFTGISVATCFHMRHKLYRFCERYVRNTRMKGQTQLDASYTSINLKGTKPNKMPRMSKKRGGKTTYSGISHHKVCIITSIDEHDNHFMRVAGLSGESFEKYQKYEKNFKAADLIVSDSKTSIKQFANYLETANDNIPTNTEYKRYTTNNGNSIQQVNQLAGELTKLITLKHGISLRYLNGYLAFICVKKMFKYSYGNTLIPEKIYDKLSLRTKTTYDQLTHKLYPVDLKEAYWEFNYGIYKH